MYAYKEIITLTDLQQITLKQPLALKKGQKVNLLVIAYNENENDELENIRDHIARQNLTTVDIQEAINWARNV